MENKFDHVLIVCLLEVRLFIDWFQNTFDPVYRIKVHKANTLLVMCCRQNVAEDPDTKAWNLPR